MHLYLLPRPLLSLVWSWVCVLLCCCMPPDKQVVHCRKRWWFEMKMHLQATENLPNATFSPGRCTLGAGDQNAEAGWKLRRRKICFSCLREDKLVRQMITFWHDQGGKYDANKTPHEGKWTEETYLRASLSSCWSVCPRPTTQHKRTRPTGGSSCRQETHLMPSYPDPAPRSPWRAYAAKRRRALANMSTTRF